MPVPIKIDNFRVRSLDIDYLEVTWGVENTSEDILDYSFKVLRSESASGPFDAITPEMEDRYVFIDNDLKAFHKHRKYYYVIRVIQKSSEDYEDFGPVAFEPEPDLVALEIRKHINLLMREFVGRRCWVLPIRTFGQRCGCWSTVLSKRQRSGCPSCFDTGFVRGYMHPIEMWIQFDPEPKTEQQTNVSILQQTNTTARLGYFPELKPRDIVIESENRRWRVNQVTSTQHLRAIVHQEVQLHEVPKSDIEYSIPLILDSALSFKDLFFSPARNYTNPANLGNFKDEEIPDFSVLYPTTYKF